ncbi:hypothetical protein D9M69_644840 [compost metagenome]
MRSRALSICSMLTGRLRSASIIEARTLVESKSARLPSFLTTTGKLTSGRSYVVKRLSQALHWRRLRTKSASSETRVSTTCVSR